jgi:sugar phosphate isomerase/epimerase
VLKNDDFPTDLNKLNEIAPYSRFEEYSKGKPSLSAFSHLMDKIRHINGIDIPILCLKNIMNEGQILIDKFIIDFTVVNEKKIDIDWVISLLDEHSYDKEILELTKIRDLLRVEKCPWII